MIYTITFNPALDYIVSVEEFVLGKTNRTSQEQIMPGGKGLNVSMVLHNLGVESVALGFIAGFTGQEIRTKVEEYGCRAEFIQLPQGFSRINLKLKSQEGTEINGMGPEIDKESLRKMMDRLELLEAGDFLILAGSIPISMPDSIYKTIIEILSKKNVQFIVDATKDLLLNVLSNKPFLIKPNNHELGELFDVDLKDRDSVIPYGKKLQEMGARNVLISMAGEGAVLVAEDGNVYQVKAPKGKLINAVGAGDSMVAGFLAGWIATKNYKEAFLNGVATGSASAFSEYLATKEEVVDLRNTMKLS